MTQSDRQYHTQHHTQHKAPHYSNKAYSTQHTPSSKPGQGKYFNNSHVGGGPPPPQGGTILQPSRGGYLQDPQTHFYQHKKRGGGTHAISTSSGDSVNNRAMGGGRNPSHRGNDVNANQGGGGGGNHAASSHGGGFQTSSSTYYGGGEMGDASQKKPSGGRLASSGRVEGSVKGHRQSYTFTEEEVHQFNSSWPDTPSREVYANGEDYYFNSYAHMGIHEEMLKDSTRTGAYQKAILNNSHLFKDKIVLEVGSGTGILCLFAAKAGAKHVYGIECSKIIDMAWKIAHLNNMSHRITYIEGKAEDVELPVEKVDIILSEWMGYFLLYEAMLDTVIFCRDKWLVKGGLIFPDVATLHIAAIEDGEYKDEKIEYWSNVYGFNYSCVKPHVMEEPMVDVVDEAAIATSSECVLTLNLNTCQKQDLNFCTPYSLRLHRQDFLHAFVAWFDIRFSACHRPFSFTTSPYGPYTHWKQTVFYMQDVLVANEGDLVEGLIAVKKNSQNPRELDIKISYKIDGGKCQASGTQFYRLK